MLARNETEAGYRPSLVRTKAHQFAVLSGCSGGGKSPLLAELGRRGAGDRSFATSQGPQIGPEIRRLLDGAEDMGCLGALDLREVKGAESAKARALETAIAG